MNKIDRLQEEQLHEVESLLHRLNPYAELLPAIKCDVDIERLTTVYDRQVMDHDHHYHEEGVHCDCGTHESHEHVTVYTHYLQGPVNSEQFEEFITELPREVYRGKGVLTFSDTSSRFLFQFAYREADYLKITPQGEVPDVVVFIGEHFDKNKLADQLRQLEASSR
ncbi:hypothetical protein D3C77_457830 [compost metagenome]